VLGLNGAQQQVPDLDALFPPQFIDLRKPLGYKPGGVGRGDDPGRCFAPHPQQVPQRRQIQMVKVRVREQHQVDRRQSLDRHRRRVQP
jgi:hypothetical protein